MNNLVFRKACENDANKICHGIERAFIPLLENYYKNGYYPYFANRNWLKEKMKNDFVYVCEFYGEIIGGIIICKNPDRVNLKIHTLYVEEPLRNRGLGRFIIETALNLHKDACLWNLETVADLANNRHLYESLGFKLVGEPKLVNDKVTIVYYSKKAK